MVVGTLKVSLHIPHAQSLKEKRHTVASLTARIRRRFNVSIAEVSEQDLWQAAGIGVVCVSSDSRHADEMCQKVLREIDNDDDALVTGTDFQLLHV